MTGIDSRVRRHRLRWRLVGVAAPLLAPVLVRLLPARGVISGGDGVAPGDAWPPPDSRAATSVDGAAASPYGPRSGVGL